MQEMGGLLRKLKASQPETWTSEMAYQTGFTPAELRVAGYAVHDLLEKLRLQGMTCRQAREEGFRPMECKAAGFSFEEARAAGYLSSRSAAERPTNEELWRSGYEAKGFHDGWRESDWEV